ncbi:MAG TPA: hypothetical protein H9903_07630 [Candidatus Aquabacterium excrementipullorum]|nr:hypothetical protein [Candidatus Aquabacterium excrementipullorum]
MNRFALGLRAVLVVLLVLAVPHAEAGMFRLSVLGSVSDVTPGDCFIQAGDTVSGVVNIDSAAPNWYGNDPLWGVYEAGLSLSYGKVSLEAPVYIYVDVQGGELFGVARIAIDEDALIYTDFRFWVGLESVESTSLVQALQKISAHGAAALQTFDSQAARIQSRADGISFSISPVPEPDVPLLALAGVCVCLGSRWHPQGRSMKKPL